MSDRGHWGVRLRHAPTRIATRLLLFNLLLVFLPVAGLLYLDTYERHLLEQQERAMIDAGRILAAALADRPIDSAETPDVLSHLAGRTDARFRIVGRDGRVLADSHASDPDEARASGESLAQPQDDAVRSSWLYRVGAAIAGTIRPLYQRPSPFIPNEPIVVAPGRIDAPEIDAALSGRYGAHTRLTPGGQRSMTLYSAIPIRQQTDVVGAVLVSQSTWRILQRLYDVRLRMVSVVAVSVGFAVVLMALASFTIVTPLRRLRDDAVVLADRRGGRLGRFRGVDRRDEIGELARALEELTRRFDAQLRSSEQFAADVTHEFRNPLASIRASAETLADVDDPADRERFRARIERDISRLEVLLNGVRDLTSVDAQLEEEPRRRLDVRDVVKEAAADRPQCLVRLPSEPLYVSASGDRLLQILNNLVENAESFTPATGPGVEIEATGDADSVRVRVRDHGPGIAPEHLTRIFDRFFCYRPDQVDARRGHSGLGLSIARTIARSYGGDIRAFNHADGGAVFELKLPRG